MEDINEYEEKYKGSPEERADIIQAYLDFEGDMDNIMASVIFADIDNEPRIREIIQKAIKKKEVPALDSFVKESKRKREQRKRRVSNTLLLVTAVFKGRFLHTAENAVNFLVFS